MDAHERSGEPNRTIGTGAARIAGQVAVVVVVGVSLYIVGPSLLAVLAETDRLVSISPAWYVVVFSLEAISFVAMWWLQKLLFHQSSWFDIATSQLAGFALGKVLPGGGAAGMALQMQMLRSTGVETGAAASGLTAFSALQIASIFGLPLLALPFILTGAPINPGLLQAAWLGAIAFVAVAGFGALMLFSDPPLEVVGRVVESLHNRFRPHHLMHDLPPRLLERRDQLKWALGAQWPKATAATFGRVVFDYLALLASLQAVGASPNPALVLLAYSAQGILTMIPLTPGGVGFVEAGLTGTLVLAGVSPRDAALAVLLYRLASYWVPMMAGGLSYGLFRLRSRQQHAA